MPPRISLDDFDTEPPSNINDDELDETTVELHPQPKSSYTETSLQPILLDSQSTHLQIVQLLNGLHSDLYYPYVLALSPEMMDAHRACNSSVKKSKESGVTPFHQNMLNYLVLRFMIPLHCPFACKAREILFYLSLKVGLDAAMATVLPEPDESFTRLMTLGGGLFRAGWRYATTVVSMELIAQAQTQSLGGSLQRNSQCRELLKQAVKEMTASSLERMQEDEINIKTYVFLVMILAQVDATEAGVSCESQVFAFRLELAELDSIRRGEVDASGGDHDDANVGTRLLDGYKERRKQQFSKKCMADVVCAGLQFVAAGRQPYWCSRHASIEH